MFRLGLLLCVVLSVSSLPARLREDDTENSLSELNVYLTDCYSVSLPARLREDGTENSLNESNVYLTAEYIQNEGYYVETHNVTTEDGYILGVYRIPYGRNKTSADGDRPVVFLMHGLYSASIAYIALGHRYSIAYNFADAGFDVWMGDARGSKNSRRHVTLDPDEDAMTFFDFSWEEIGMYDVAAMVDYALQVTGKDKLHYVGHSQGGTVFLVLNSMRPEYNEKFASAHLLAGVGYMEHFPNTELANVAVLTDLIYSTVVGMGYLEVYPPNSTQTEADSAYSMVDYCLGDVSMRHVCRAIGMRDLLSEFDLESFFQSNDAVGGGSLKQIAHYGQNIRDKIFRRFHYGSLDNQEIYNAPEPPAYNLSLITTNTVMHYTISDDLLDERDVLAMNAVMPNSVVRKVARDSFKHEDFAAAPDVKELVTKFMVEFISDIEGFEYTDIFDDVEDDAQQIPPIDDNQGEQNPVGDTNYNDDGDGGQNSPADAADTDQPSSSSNVVLSVILQFYFVGYAFCLIKN